LLIKKEKIQSSEKKIYLTIQSIREFIKFEKFVEQAVLLSLIFISLSLLLLYFKNIKDYLKLLSTSIFSGVILLALSSSLFLFFIKRNDLKGFVFKYLQPQIKENPDLNKYASLIVDNFLSLTYRMIEHVQLLSIVLIVITIFLFVIRFFFTSKDLHPQQSLLTNQT
jgi:hypothetical protein